MDKCYHRSSCQIGRAAFAYPSLAFCSDYSGVVATSKKRSKMSFEHDEQCEADKGYHWCHCADRSIAELKAQLAEAQGLWI